MHILWKRGAEYLRLSISIVQMWCAQILWASLSLTSLLYELQLSTEVELGPFSFKLFICKGVLSQIVKTMTFQYWGCKINFIPIHYSHITIQVWFLFPILITLTYWKKNSWPWKFWNAVITYINNTKQNHRKV